MPSLPFRAIESVDCRQICQIHYDFVDAAAVTAFEARCCRIRYQRFWWYQFINNESGATAMPTNPLLWVFSYDVSNGHGLCDFIVMFVCWLLLCLPVLLKLNCESITLEAWWLIVANAASVNEISNWTNEGTLMLKRAKNLGSATPQHSSFGGDCNLLWRSDCVAKLSEKRCLMALPAVARSSAPPS